MPMQGRHHMISDEAVESANHILDKIPKELLFVPSLIRFTGSSFTIAPSTKPLWTNLLFKDTQGERDLLNQEAIQYNNLFYKNPLVAHGTQSCHELCQILTDCELKHLPHHEAYGSLSCGKETIQTGGYWDKGWGVFVGKSKTIALHYGKVDNYVRIPLSELEGILLPTPVVDVVRKEFPQYRDLLKGYTQFAQEMAKQVDMNKGNLRRMIYYFFGK